MLVEVRAKTVTSEKDILASEYALGTLDADQRLEVERLLQDDPDFAKSVDEWNARLAPLVDAVESVDPPKSVWETVQRRMGKNNTALPAGVLAVTKDQGHWYSHSNNVEVKSLYIDEEMGSESYLLKFGPGGVVEEHAHGDWNDECIVMEGTIHVGGVSFGPGDFHVATRGAVHPRLYSEGGGVLFVRSRRITGVAA